MLPMLRRVESVSMSQPPAAMVRWVRSAPVRHLANPLKAVSPALAHLPTAIASCSKRPTGNASARATNPVSPTPLHRSRSQTSWVSRRAPCNVLDNASNPWSETEVLWKDSSNNSRLLVGRLLPIARQVRSPHLRHLEKSSTSAAKRCIPLSPNTSGTTPSSHRAGHQLKSSLSLCNPCPCPGLACVTPSPVPSVTGSRRLPPRSRAAPSSCRAMSSIALHLLKYSSSSSKSGHSGTRAATADTASVDTSQHSPRSRMNVFSPRASFRPPKRPIAPWSVTEPH
mmetsp:Transcript_50714/g.133694  ORF Transcript_50714/g.133694 Transcript_50714/m.133694 type:complete len:283 (-) Transcript_50714:16-864(-)